MKICIAVPTMTLMLFNEWTAKQMVTPNIQFFPSICTSEDNGKHINKLEPGVFECQSNHDALSGKISKTLAAMPDDCNYFMKTETDVEINYDELEYVLSHYSKYTGRFAFVKLMTWLDRELLSTGALAGTNFKIAMKTEDKAEEFNFFRSLPNDTKIIDLSHYYCGAHQPLQYDLGCKVLLKHKDCPLKYPTVCAFEYAFVPEDQIKTKQEYQALVKPKWLTQKDIDEHNKRARDNA
ncbi:hypothetical protein NQZ79_g3017 [Umbelopsis isabellina]|nr:hypothetical protein NQZ79_g3017 [Umbelopsis isabellina]